MPAPTQITGSPWQSSWSGTTQLVTAGGNFSVGVGDLLVVMAAIENNGFVAQTPTNTGTATISWSAKGAIPQDGNGANTYVGAWVGTVTGAGTVTVSVSISGTGQRGVIVWGFTAASHNGVGQAPAAVDSGTSTGAPSITANWAANSFVCCINADWAAIALATRHYLTNIGTATEDNYIASDGNYTTDAWHYADSGAGGNVAVGMSDTGQRWSMVAVEVQGVSAGVAAGVAVAPKRFPMAV